MQHSTAASTPRIELHDALCCTEREAEEGRETGRMRRDEGGGGRGGRRETGGRIKVKTEKEQIKRE